VCQVVMLVIGPTASSVMPIPGNMFLME
jgi:hypothetical protein